MNQVMISRGFLVLCNSCLFALKEDQRVDSRGRAQSDEVIHDLCANCYDYNKPLIDDTLGSSE
jgi:hypothetical protein